MENNLKICTKCQTVNDANANFCRSCGTPMPAPQDTTVVFNSVNNEQVHQEQQTQQAQQPNFEQSSQPSAYPSPSQPYGNYYNPYQAPNDVYGVETKDLAAFVGQNSNNFIPKFFKIGAGNKSTWNWPVFILTFIFGPIGTAFWFFHRKMNKIASILLAVGLVLACLQIYFVFDTVNTFTDEINSQAYDSGYTTYKEYYGYSEDAFNQFLDERMDNIINNVSSQMVLVSTLSMLLNLAKIIFSIVIALFANYLYLKFAVEKIMNIKQRPMYPGQTTLSVISQTGGTYFLFWILTIIGFVVIKAAAYSVIIINAVNALTDLFI